MNPNSSNRKWNYAEISFLLNTKSWSWLSEAIRTNAALHFCDLISHSNNWLKLHWLPKIALQCIQFTIFLVLIQPVNVVAQLSRLIMRNYQIWSFCRNQVLIPGLGPNSKKFKWMNGTLGLLSWSENVSYQANENTQFQATAGIIVIIINALFIFFLSFILQWKYSEIWIVSFRKLFLSLGCYCASVQEMPILSRLSRIGPKIKCCTF